MIKHFFRFFVAACLMAVLAACGGGGGSAGTPSTGGSSTPPGGTATAAVSDIVLFTDRTTITNSGTDTVALTVVAVDANRNAAVGAVVSVATDQNSFFTPSAAGALTDGNGRYTGAISIGTDKSDREITISVTINGITKNTTVRVTGSRLTLQATPSTPAPGQAVDITATLLDAAGNAIRGVSVSFSGSLPGIQNRTAVTGSNGQAVVSLTAPLTAGAYTVSAAGGGVNAAALQLQVFSSAIPAAVIPAGVVPSLSASPNVLATNSAGSTTNRSTLRFLFLDGSNRPIPNVRVRFVDQTVGLPAVGASIVNSAQTLYTDASGTVLTQYIAGQNTSPTNGVVVRACYSATDFASATDCPNFVSATLTIAGQALAVSIGDDNLLVVGNNGLTYIKRFAVTVADAAGRAVANAPVDISVDLTHYGKGSFSYGPATSTFSYTNASGTPTQPLLVVPSDLGASYPSGTSVPGSGTVARVWCANEDTNRSGNVDPGENFNNSVDSNGQPTLEPRKSDLIVSYDDPAVTTTNASGVLVIRVEYAQRFATWLAYKVRVTANVAGSQGLAERLFVTNFVDGAQVNGSFLQPPYGTGACNAAN